MPSHRRLPASLRGVLAIATMAGTACSPPVAETTVLRCSASDIHHVFRIPASLQQVEDLSATPPRRGQVSVADGSYVLSFVDTRDHYELVVVIDRVTGRGTRELFDDEQQLVRGHGGSDAIVCIPDGAPRQRS